MCMMGKVLPTGLRGSETDSCYTLTRVVPVALHLYVFLHLEKGTAQLLSAKILCLGYATLINVGNVQCS